MFTRQAVTFLNVDLDSDRRAHSVGNGGVAILPVTGVAAIGGGNLMVQLLGVALIAIFAGILLFRWGSSRSRAVMQAGVNPTRHRASRGFRRGSGS
ncbi:hypothetical protein AB0F81_19060 [Actinoplanes sp. NPDC024001]|uniref:hypothetical protein n=1 Tax=Actinoplanes sp. NPDC024001 TaxID=3154598 RepID=UPI0033E6011F